MLSKTMIVVVGADNIAVADYLNTRLSPDEYEIVQLSYEYQTITAQLKLYDQDVSLADIIFVATDAQAATKMIGYKYDEKILLKDIVDPRSMHAPSATWHNVDELPSLIERLERNVSEHANF